MGSLTGLHKGYRELSDELLVAGVQPGGAAASAGLRRGDIILDANRRAMTGLADWEARVRDAKPGQKFLVRTQRGFFVITAQ